MEEELILSYITTIYLQITTTQLDITHQSIFRFTIMDMVTTSTMVSTDTIRILLIQLELLLLSPEAVFMLDLAVELELSLVSLLLLDAAAVL